MREQPKITYYALARHDGGVEIMHCLGDAEPAGEIKKWPEVRRNEIASWRQVSRDEIPAIRAARGDGGSRAP